MSAYALGIDIGGTFTDIVAYDINTGHKFNRKVLTTHDDPSTAVIDGINLLITMDGLEPGDTQRVVHATTLFTNALIERQGARTGVITTEGFRDTLEIGRERKYNLYDITIRKPEALVPRNLRMEAYERMNAKGEILAPLDTDSVLAAGQALNEAGAESIAIIFLHAYANACHEIKAAEILALAFPDISVSTSSEVAPEIREYERASTTAANAYIKPLAERYLDSLVAKIKSLSIEAPLHLMISSGGLTHLMEAKRAPVQMLESGPAAGALAGAYFGNADAKEPLIAFDMGGTTAKLCLIEGGEPLVAHGFEAGRQERFVEGSGLPIRISTIDLIEIGAGGGSIASVNDLGFLKVGPKSAGSEPGPAAYGRGSEYATVTDADFALGYLNPEHFAAGMLDIDLDASKHALNTVAKKAGLTRNQIAWGIHDVVNENMVGAARVHIAERGRDPRDFTLLCTGGAGPVHAYYVAKKLGLRKIICPGAAGVASALGMLVAPVRVDRVTTISAQLAECNLQELEDSFRALEEDAQQMIAEAGLDTSTIHYQRFADGRYIGQGFELSVPLPEGPYSKGNKNDTRTALHDAFEAGYREKFSRTPLEVPIEFTNIRLAARAAIPDVKKLRLPSDQKVKIKENAQKGQRPVYFPETESFVDTAVYDWGQLTIDDRFQGPAIIEDDGSTLVIGPGSYWEVSKSGNVIVHLAD